MVKKTWIVSHKAPESFGWMFLDGFDVLKLFLHRLPAKAAKVSGCIFGKTLLTLEECWKEKNIFFISKHLRVE